MDARQMQAGMSYRVTPSGIQEAGTLQARINRLRSQGFKPTGICPFHCDEHEMDEHGYCRHLVGFTNATDREIQEGKGLMEPMKRRRGRYVVQVPRERYRTDEVEEEEERDAEGNLHTIEVPVWEEGPPQLEPILATDQVIRLTATARVYRNVARPERRLPNPPIMVAK